MATSHTGAVLGIDAGYSKTKETTGICVLSWDRKDVFVKAEVVGSHKAERKRVIENLLPPNIIKIDALAIDGPLRPGLKVDTKNPKSSENLLIRGAFAKRSKPGPCNSSTGKTSGSLLHKEATALAKIALDCVSITPSPYKYLGQRLAIAESFPNLFLGLLLGEAAYPARPVKNRNWTDTLYPMVRNKLERIVKSILPGRSIHGLGKIESHDEIAAYVCAVGALCLASKDFTAAGSTDDGFVILPPSRFWAKGAIGAAAAGSWGERELRKVIGPTSQKFPGVAVYEGAKKWITP